MAGGAVVATGVAAVAGAVTSLATSGVADAAGVLVLGGDEMAPRRKPLQSPALKSPKASMGWW
jgi:hypothetical protein